MADQFAPEPADNVNIAEAAAADNNNRPPPPPAGGLPNNRPPQLHPLFNIQDRLFHAMFYRAAVAYAQAVPPGLRVVLELCALFKVLFLTL